MAITLPKSLPRNQRGQLVVEYVLLVMVTVILATLVISRLVKRDPDNPGALLSRWQHIIEWIAADDPGAPQR